jgi:hypothetical protein
MSERPQRVFLGSMLGVGERMRVFRTPDALEVDSSDHYEIQRRRVFLDEVQLVTLHRGLGGGVYPWVLGGLTLFTGFIAAVSFTIPDATEIRNGFLLATAVLAALAVASGFLPAWTVTVYGRRTRARMRYRFREGKARAVYAEICAAVAEAQSPSPPDPLSHPLPSPGRGGTEPEQP